VLKAQNKYEEAGKLAEESVAWARTQSSQALLADMLGQVGQIIFQKGDYKSALKIFEEQRLIRNKIGPESEVGGLTMNIGVMHYRMGDLEGSLPYYNFALESYTRQKDTMNLGHVWVNFAMTYNDLGQIPKALECMDKASYYYLAINDMNNYSNIISNSTFIYINAGEYGKAMKMIVPALERFEKNNDKKNMATAYGSMSSVNLHMRDTVKALEYIDRAVALQREIGLSGSLGYSLIGKGNILSAKGQLKEAEICYREAMSIRMKNNDKMGMAGSHLSLGNNFKRMALYDSSLYHYQTALQIYESSGKKQSVAGLYSNIGVVYYDLGEYDKALENYQKAFEIRKDLGLKQDLYETYLTYSNVYKKMGNYEKAYEYYQKYFIEYDSLNNATARKEVLDLQTKYDTDKKQKEIELLSARERMQGLAFEKQNALLMFERLQLEQKGKEVELLNKDKSLKEAELLREREAKMRKQKEVDALQQENLLKEEINAKQRQMTSIFIGAFVLMLITSGVIFRFYRQNRRAKIIISQQKEEVEQKKNQIELQKELMEEKNREITDSIRYAKRLQDAILPPTGFFRSLLPDSFVFYQPKDIVAGDFYWIEKSDDTIFLAVADCTGHGVPGAMVSIVGHNGLERCVKEFGLKDPEAILDKLNELVEGTFSRSEGQVRDGMDIALCIIKKSGDSTELTYSGANNPLWIIRADNTLEEIKADKQPIGRYDNRKPFTAKKVRLLDGDQIYLFSDGYADQFGGPSGKKFKYSRMKEELIQMAGSAMEEQSKMLSRKFHEWKGNLEQIDDVCVIGVRL
ncbi:MAG TPA: tetratricopeptide repeat protein, partial [Flavobacteriales bacterium]|nr:tetratricopeptide repeat protein [Flavobacteriales bacterium]